MKELFVDLKRELKKTATLSYSSLPLLNDSLITIAIKFFHKTEFI